MTGSFSLADTFCPFSKMASCCTLSTTDGQHNVRKCFQSCRLVLVFAQSNRRDPGRQPFYELLHQCRVRKVIQLLGGSRFCTESLNYRTRWTTADWPCSGITTDDGSRESIRGTFGIRVYSGKTTNVRYSDVYCTDSYSELYNAKLLSSLSLSHAPYRWGDRCRTLNINWISVSSRSCLGAETCW